MRASTGLAMANVYLTGQLRTGAYDVVGRRRNGRLHKGAKASWWADGAAQAIDPLPMEKITAHMALTAVRPSGGIFAGRMRLATRLRDCEEFTLLAGGRDEPVQGILQPLTVGTTTSSS